MANRAGQGSQDNASDIRKDYESQLKDLTAKVYEAKGGEAPGSRDTGMSRPPMAGGGRNLQGSSGRAPMTPQKKAELAQNQDQLAKLYNKIAEAGVEIDGQHEQRA